MSNIEYYDYIKENISLEEVCNLLGMAVVQKSSNKWSLCPFHNDHNPSMKLYTDDNPGAFHCFVCGAHGDIFSLIQKELNCNFTDCMKWIDMHFPSIARETEKYSARSKTINKSGFQLALKCFQSMSIQEFSKLGTFASSRGYTSEFLKNHEIYYVTSDKLLHQYMNDVEARNLLLESLLLKEVVINNAVESEIKIDYQSVFSKDKIMITLRNYRNQIIGYAARAIDNSRPKYLFTRKLPKGDFLYGLNTIQHTYAGISDQMIHIYITEGVFDALRLMLLGLDAVAVLGSHITKKQTDVLAQFISDMETQNNHVSLSLFLDSDEAGMQGANSSIRNLWFNNIVRTKAIIDVCVNKENFLHDNVVKLKKDPDEIFKELSDIQDNQLNQYRIDALEYILRYALDDCTLGLRLSGSFRDMYQKLSLEQRTAMLGKVSRIISINYWQDIFDVYQVFDHALPKNNFVLNLLKRYFGLLKIGSISDFDSRTFPDQNVFSTAIECAKSSYTKEDTPLDESTWNRLFYTVDVFDEYFSDYFVKGNHLDIPLISFDIPKKTDEYRPKKMYCHEQLIMQQYVLDELLREDTYRNYQYSIPAVRYDPRQNPVMYVTGNEYYKEHTDDVVSFAYQINMPVMNGECPSTDGMFRPYYDCWKSFIVYIRDGINLMPVEQIYKVKLDITKFYDSVTSYSVQRFFQGKILNALSVTNNSFSRFGDDDNKAARITKWVIDELFDCTYYRSDTGKKEQKENTLRGIPQGPNLSAYVANSLLFDLDFSVLQYVNKVNEQYQTNHPNEIAVRFARYVDDMVIVAVKSEFLLDIEEIITQKLGELELTLSPKTDDAICIDKEDTYEWLISEKGGLGVSLASDEAIEPAEDIFNLAQEYDSIDRRKALSMLHSYTMDIGMLTVDTLEEIIMTFFKSEEIRYNDIVRFSELYLKYLHNCGTESYNLYEEFNNNLGNYCTSEYCPSGSMLLRKGILTVAFLQACVNILKAVDNGKNDQYKKAIANFVHDSHNLDSQISFENDICQKNHWTIYIKILQLYQLTADITSKGEILRCPAETVLKKMDQLNDENRNEYRIRWQFSIEDSCGIANIGQNLIDSFSKIVKEETDLSRFHSAVHYLPLVSQKEEFNQLKEKVAHNITMKIDEDALYRCLCVWFAQEFATGNDSRKVIEERDIQTAIKIFINIVNSTAIAEIVEDNAIFQQCLFPKGESLEYIPVPPGVNYPGILAIRSDTAHHVKDVCRVDFNSINSPGSEKYIDIPKSDSKWNRLQSLTQNCNSYKSEIANDCMTIRAYFQIQDNGLYNETLTNERITQIAHLHEVLSDCIKGYEDNNSTQNLISSYSNVLIQNGDPHILTYEIDENICGVAISQGRSVRFQTVSNVCDYYWKAGHIIKDALNLKALDNTKCNDEQYEFLNYILKRLTGEQFGRYSFLNSEQSYTYSVKRARQALRDYAEKGDPKERKLFLTDYKLINTFIAHRLEQTDYSYAFGDLEYQFAMFAKKCLYTQIEPISDLLKDASVCQTGNLFTRRVPSAFLALGKRLNQICDRESFKGIQALVSGLFALAVMSNLKQQVTEYVYSLTTEERSAFLDVLENGEADFSWELLGVDITQVKLVIGYNDQVEALTNKFKKLLQQKNIQHVKRITPIGWLVMLCFLMELNKTEQFIVQKNNHETSKKPTPIPLSTLFHSISIVTQHLQCHDNDIVSQDYPFEGTNNFISNWKENSIDDISAVLNLIDNWNQIKVQLNQSAIYKFAVNRQKVTVHIVGYEPLEGRPLYFMTYQCLRFNTEKEVDNNCRFVWTQTICHDRIIGISSIDQELSKLAFPVITEEQPQSSSADSATTTSEEKEKDTHLPPISSNLHAETEIEEVPIVTETTDSLSMNEKSCSSDDNFIQYVQNIQWQNWEDRGTTRDSNGTRSQYRVFANIDRIALLQFDSDSSYFHPDSEVCFLDKKYQEEQRYSCAEFRRRKILDKVFATCRVFKVDILLLPEYSVRPETVLWMKKKMEEENYQFSVWAGTFRIPINSNHTVEDVLNLPQGEKIHSYLHSAVLPVITRDKNKRVIIARRFKKYPATNLQEVIHPQIDSNTFSPILKQENDDELYQDARDDITELICAEIFVITSPSNYNEAMHSAFELYRRYVKSPVTWDNFREKCFADIKTFGENTAFHQFSHKYGRHSIVLVPACTTRAADYYISGQANYLAAGLTTVFCNMTSCGDGGSCFIGTDSWDKSKGENAAFKEKYMPDDTPYFGISPGIYQQNSCDDSRGALGEKEQALVICDVNPQISFAGKPNPESMGKPLELVAHLPIIEISDCSGIKPDDNASDGTINRKCRCSIAIKNESEQKCKKDSLKDICNIIYYAQSKPEINCEMAKKVREIFRKMGQHINSDWLVKRGEQFYNQYNNSYQNLISPNLLDWIFVNVKYPRRDKIESNINVPKFCDIDEAKTR